MGESHAPSASRGEVTGAKLITYECIAADHQPTANGADKLTIIEGAWAFCPFNARTTGHAWRHTDGEAFDVLLRHAGLSANLDQREVATHAKSSSLARGHHADHPVFLV